MAATEDLRIRVLADGTIAVQRQIENIGTTAKRASRDVYLLNRTLQGVGVGLLVREFVQLADSLTSINNRLSNVTSSSAELKAVTAELFAVSNRTRSSFEDNANLYNRMALATREFGLAQSDLLRITETMNQAITISGVRSQEASNALIQLSQGMSAGRLNGDELRSVLEQLPPIADILARQLGVTRGELRKLGADGKITTQVIIEAFQGAEEEIATAFAKMTPTIGQSFVVLRNEIIAAIGNLDEATKFTSTLSKAILWAAENMETLTRVIGALAIVLGPALLVGALSIATAAVWAFTFALATNPILAIITVLAALVAVVVMFGDQIDMAADTMANLQDVGWATWESIVSGAQMAWAAISPLFEFVSQALGGIQLDMQTFLTGIVWGLDKFYQVNAAVVLGAIALWKTLPDATMEQVVNMRNLAVQAFAEMLNEIIRFFVLLPERMLTAIADGINLMIEAFGQFVEWLKTVPQAIGDIFTNAMTLAKMAVLSGIDWIANQFERIPGISIPDFAGEAANDLIQIGVENADSVAAGLTSIAEGYDALKRGEDLIQFDSIANKYEGASEALGQAMTEAFNEGMAQTPVSDWWERTLARAEELARGRADAERLLAADRANNAGILNNPGVMTPGAGGTDAAGDAKELKRIKKLKDDLAELDMAMDNQVLQDQGRIREIENTQAAQLLVIKQALDARILTEQQAADRVVAIRETAARKIRDIEFARYSEQLTAASDMFSSLSDIAKTFAGEQSGIYKAMFIASKAFAIADSIIKIQQGIANALALPFPANLGAVATVAAQAASIVSNIQAVSLALADGGYVSGPGSGRSDSIPAMLSNGEYVVNAQATSAYRPLLESINSGGSPVMASHGGSGSGGGGVTVQVVDQRSNGAQVEIERSTDGSGNEVIRAIIRDEVAQVYEQTAKQRSLETIATVRKGQKRGAFFGG